MPSNADVPPVKACALFLPGHSVHWIQARKSREDRRGEKGQVHAVDGDVLEVVVSGHVRRYRNHEPDRVAVLLAGVGGRAFVQEQWSVLRLGPYLISIAADDDPLAECVVRTGAD